jgi:hypothetical protein
MVSLLTSLGNSSRAFFERVLREPRLTLVRGGRLARLGHLVSLFSRSDENAETLLREKFSELRFSSDLSDYETYALSRLMDLMDLRALAFGRPLAGVGSIRQALVQSASVGSASGDFEWESSLQDITSSATRVAELYWKLLDTCRGSIPELRTVGLQLYYHLFNAPFESQKGSERISQLVDSMQRDLGVPFLVLSLLRQGKVSGARALGRYLIQNEVELENPNTASTLYWLAELLWFKEKWSSEKLSYETSLKLLYPLCFVSPERASFLEIDSLFYSEFENVNELALEAFNYRETLVDELLFLWKHYEGDFDALFQSVMESILGKPSKIVNQRSSWEKHWLRSGEQFSKEYLYVVEGNLAFSAGHFEAARSSYESALQLSPGLRPALLNQLFVHARLNRVKDHFELADRVLVDRKLMPAALSVIGNSFLLSQDEDSADTYYETLRDAPGWDKKVDYYKSTFCYQHGLFAQAARFARNALVKNPADTASLYHLSLCLVALGEKERALELLSQVESLGELPWLRFFQFTLEREVGDLDSAARTLASIPLDYFDDDSELELAIAFAKGRQDLGLLRQLRRKKLSST